MELTPEQEKIRGHDGAQIVVAGAGTGKTATLTQRILYLLLKENCSLHEIVAMTFTEKAAAEMRERIYETLLEAASETSDERRKTRLKQLCIDFPAQNRITTIDGFNSSLLSTYPEYSSLPQNYQIADDYSQSVLKLQIQQQFLRALEKEDALFEKFLGLRKCIKQNTLLENIKKLAEYSEEDLQWLKTEISKDEFAENLIQIANLYTEKFWRAFVDSIPADFPELLRQKMTDLKTVRNILTKTKGTLSKRNKIVKSFGANIPLLPSETSQYYMAWLELDENNNLSRQTDFEEDWKCYSVLRDMAEMASLYRKTRLRIVSQKGLLDFSDIANATLQMLKNNPHLCNEIRRGIRHILVDEFQDTSPEQWEMIELIRRENNVMVVGDPKQSIYRFRGADVTVFNDIQQDEFSADQQRELTVSQRACPALVDFYNHNFAQVLATNDDRLDYEAQHQDLRIAGRKENDKGSVTWLDSTDEKLEESSGKTEKNPHEALALFLKILQDDAQRLERGEKVLLPQYQDIAERIGRNEAAAVGVLFRSHSAKNKAEQVLRSKNVDFTSYHGRGFYKSMSAALAINLARFLHDPQDSLALAGLLRSPICGLPDTILLELSIINPVLWLALDEYVAAENTDNILLKHAHYLLNKWIEDAQILPFSGIFEKVWYDSQLPFYFALDGDSQEKENFFRLIDILKTAQQDSGYGLLDIVNFLQTMRDSDSSEAQAELPTGGSIQLMTVHASKGLGFPMTILPQMGKMKGGRGEGIYSGNLDNSEQKYFAIKNHLPENDQKKGKTETLLYNLLKNSEKSYELAESKRQYYVACTRAKEHLVLLPADCGVVDTWGNWASRSKSCGFIEHEYDLQKLNDLAARDLAQIEQEQTSFIDASVELPLSGDALPSEISVSRLLDNLSPEIEPYFSNEDVEAPGEMSGDERKTSVQNAKARGTLIHRLLEWNWDLDEKSTFTELRNLMIQEKIPLESDQQMASLLRATQRELRRLPFVHSAAIHETAFSLGAESLQEFLQEKKKLSPLQDWLQRDAAAHWCNGVIDYLVPLSSGDGYAILDFKTHWSDPQSYPQEVRERIKMQLQIYAIAATKMGIDIKQLYALRIYGVTGEVAAEQYDLPN